MPYKTTEYSFKTLTGDDAELFSKRNAEDGIVYIIPSEQEMVWR